MMEIVDHATFRIPTLRTEHFVMRAPKKSDLAAYNAFRTSDRARGVGGPFSAEQTHDKLSAIVGHWHLEGFGRWVVADADDQPLGVVGLMCPHGWPEPEIGWSVFEDAEGKSVAFEAAKATRAFAYDVLGWSTVISCVMPDNARSRALAERLGATHEGILEHPMFGPLHIYRHQPPEALQ